MSEDERYITIKQTNRRMPRIGLGTADMKSPSEMIYEAIKKGYRHIDTAAWYKNESEIGDGIARAIADGLVTRDELFVTSKLYVAKAQYWNFAFFWRNSSVFHFQMVALS